MLQITEGRVRQGRRGSPVPPWPAGDKAPSVDGGGKRAVRPRKWPIWWMARAKGRFVHQKGRFGGWRTAGDGDGNGAAKQKRDRLFRVSLMRGGSRIRIKSTKPSTDPCYNDFYCVFLQVEFFDSACFWDIFGIRF